MVCKTLLALCIFTAGLRVQSLPTSTSLPVSLPAKITPPASTWTSSAQNPVALTASPASGVHNTSVLPVTDIAPTSALPKHVSIEPTEEAITSPSSSWEGTNPGPSLPAFLSTSSVVHVTPMPEEHNSSSPEVSVPAEGSQSPTSLSPQAPASSPSSSSSTLPPEILSASVTSNHSTTVTSTQTTGAPATSESPTEEHSSGHTPTSQATMEPVPKEKTQQETEPKTVICESETTTTFLIMQEVEHALSSGSIAAITVTVIAVVLLVFGVAAYLKIRHSSYGRLLDDHDYGSWGNYNNPLYDDS
uniref:Prostate androgen-regulated mucin-like protein 1 n=1 Tax=Spermophilus dauricus TaxID=99837 RepID=A0A8C9PX19_SPEDA